MVRLAVAWEPLASGVSLLPGPLLSWYQSHQGVGVSGYDVKALFPPPPLPRPMEPWGCGGGVRRWDHGPSPTPLPLCFIW